MLNNIPKTWYWTALLSARNFFPRLLLDLYYWCLTEMALSANHFYYHLPVPIVNHVWCLYLLKHLTDKPVFFFFFFCKYSISVVYEAKSQCLLSGVQALVSPFTCSVIRTSCSSFLGLNCKLLTYIPTVVKGTWIEGWVGAL